MKRYRPLADQAQSSRVAPRSRAARPLQASEFLGRLLHVVQRTHSVPLPTRERDAYLLDGSR